MGSGTIDFEKWYVSGLPLPLIAACAACQKGVKRAHLVDARMDGALLLELYSRDGVGTMLSADFYEVSYCTLLPLPPAVGCQQAALVKTCKYQAGYQGICL